MSAAVGYVYQNVGYTPVSLSGWHIGVVALAPVGHNKRDDDVTAYIEQNVGYLLVPSDEATGLVHQNVGFNLQSEDEAIGYVYQNVVE